MRIFRAIVVGLALCLANPVTAGPFEDGLAAIERKNYSQAAKWFRKAADQDNANAQYSLGVMYATGQGVLRNYIQAVAWYRKAADQGHTNAQNNLGVMYTQGHGVPQNYILAHMWLSLSISKGGFGASVRDTIAVDMTTAQITEAQKRALEWKPKAKR